jgi:hypothetical protein
MKEEEAKRNSKNKLSKNEKKLRQKFTLVSSGQNINKEKEQKNPRELTNRISEKL